MVRVAFIALALASGGGLYWTWQVAEDAAEIARSIKAEGADRRDQTCRLFERDERAAVDRLVQTYDFLRRPGKLKNLVPVARAQVPALESDARTSDAPPYCDAPGVGLPESLERPIPKRPPGL